AVSGSAPAPPGGCHLTLARSRWSGKVSPVWGCWAILRERSRFRLARLRRWATVRLFAAAASWHAPAGGGSGSRRGVWPLGGVAGVVGEGGRVRAGAGSPARVRERRRALGGGFMTASGGAGTVGQRGRLCGRSACSCPGLRDGSRWCFTGFLARGHAGQRPD